MPAPTTQQNTPATKPAPPGRSATKPRASISPLKSFQAQRAPIAPNGPEQPLAFAPPSFTTPGPAISKAGSTSIQRQSEPNPEPKNDIAVTFTVPYDLPAGDPGNKGLILSLQHRYGISRSKAIELMVAQDWHWTNTFKGAKKGQKLTCTTPATSYRNGLRFLYGTMGQNTTGLMEDFLERPDSDNQDLLQKMSSLNNALEKLTAVELQFFIKLQKKKGNVVFVNIKNASLDDIQRTLEAIQDFQKNKIELLSDKDLIEAYLSTPDAQSDESFKALVDKLYSLDPALINKFIQFDDWSWKNLFTPVTMKVAEWQTLEKSLNRVGVSMVDFAMFLISFRKRALAKGYALLKESKDTLVTEKLQYSNQEGFDALIKTLQGQAPNYNQADDLRVQGIIKFCKANQSSAGVFSGNAAKQMIISRYWKQTGGKAQNIKKLIQGMSGQHIYNAFKGADDYLPTPMVGIPGGAIPPAQFKGKNSTFDQNYPEFKQANEMDQQTNQNMVQAQANHHPILADQETDWRLVSRMPKDKIKQKVFNIITERLENVDNTVNNLNGDPDLIWEFKPLLFMTMQELGINKDDNLGKLVLNQVEIVDRNNTIISIGLAALGIVLAIGGIFTGGASTVAGAALIGASVVVSAIDLFREAREYNVHNAASRTHINAAQSLSNKNPNLFGVYMAIFGLVLDVADVIKVGTKVFRALNGLVDAADELAMAAKLDVLYDSLEEAGQLAKGVSKKQFKEQVLAIYRQDQALIKSAPAEFAELMGKINAEELPGIMRVGLYRIYTQDPGLAKQLVGTFGQEPIILSRLGSQATLDPNMAAHFNNLYKLMGNQSMDAFRYIGTIGQDTTARLPQLVDLMVKGNITDPNLLRQLLQNRQLQQLALARADDPQSLIQAWRKYSANPDGQTFVQFYKQQQQTAFYGLLGKYSADINKAAKADPNIREDLIKIGGVNEETLKRLISDQPFRDALAANPLAAKAMKKCASPCFPANANAAQINKLNQILEGKNLSGDQMRAINEMLYQARGSVGQLDAAIARLEGNFDAVLSGLRLQEAADVTIPVVFRHGSGAVANMEQKVAKILGDGVPANQLKQVLAMAARNKINGTKFMDALSRASGRYAKGGIKNLGEVLNGLASTSGETFQTANSMLRLMAYDNIGTSMRFIDEALGQHRLAGVLADDSLLKRIDDALPDFDPTKIDASIRGDFFVEYSAEYGKREGWKAWMRSRMTAKTPQQFYNDMLQTASGITKQADKQALNALIGSGRIDRFNLVRAFKNTPPAQHQEMLAILTQLDALKGASKSGVDQVVGDFAAGANKYKGAWWMCSYLNSKGLLTPGRLRGFESPSPVASIDKGRRYDAVVSGRQGTYYIQFKAWDNWSSDTFIKQFIQDIDVVSGNLGNIRWVFNGTIPKTELIAKATAAINASTDAKIVAQRQNILSKLNRIIRVGAENL